MEIQTRRIYDPPAAKDGTRILVDALWPRGISKRQARLDGWWRTLAPGKELRKWFAHDPSRWEGFNERYFTEPDAKHEALSGLSENSSGGRLILLFLQVADPADQFLDIGHA